MTGAEAALRLHNAFTSTRAQRVHLCPLDLGGEIPELIMGPLEVRRFTPAELLDLVDPLGFERIRPHWNFDARSFSQFTWLKVAEETELAGEPGARTVPSLFLDLGEDYGRIEPHRRRFPEAVENGLFGLLIAPWEDWTEYRDINWRCFTVPWAHTVDHDLFARSERPPPHETLTWVPDIIHLEDGDEIETERPEYYRVNHRISEARSWLTDATWNDVAAALQSPLLETPVAHFLVRAFLSEGIDEFLAHLTMIEAAIGLPNDKTPARKARLAALLDDPAAGGTYGRLFQRRSEFVHGRKMTDIPGAERDEARILARRVAAQLVKKAAAGSHETRQTFLEQLAA